MNIYEDEYLGYGNKGINHHGMLKAKYDMNLRSKVKNPDRLVPLNEVYILPEIFSSNKKTDNSKVNDEIVPRGYDRHGLMEIPSKERIKKEFAHRLTNRKIYTNLQGDVKLNPLNVDLPSNDKVYYVNVGGIRKIIPDYNLNPVYKFDPKKPNEEYYQNDANNQQVLKDFLKIIQEKKRRRKVNTHARTKLKDESDRQRVSTAYKIHMNPKRGINTKPTREFAPLSDINNFSAVEVNKNAKKRISFSDIIKESSENNKGNQPKNSELNQRIYVPGKVEADDLLEDRSHENVSEKLGEQKVVRFQLPDTNNKPKKKYVSPPPQMSYAGTEEDEDDYDEND
ncbi:Uncharacterized protein CTYZ_00002783, partial [Cryptosporidium tyzzeri]